MFTGRIVMAMQTLLGNILWLRHLTISLFYIYIKILSIYRYILCKKYEYKHFTLLSMFSKLSSYPICLIIPSNYYTCIYLYLGSMKCKTLEFINCNEHSYFGFCIYNPYYSTCLIFVVIFIAGEALWKKTPVWEI